MTFKTKLFRLAMLAVILASGVSSIATAQLPPPGVCLTNYFIGACYNPGAACRTIFGKAGTCQSPNNMCVCVQNP